jgi:hypothetical protein
MKTEGGYPGHPYWVRLRESALPPFARAGVFARIRVMGVDQNVSIGDERVHYLDIFFRNSSASRSSRS